MSIRLYCTAWEGRFETGRDGLPDYVWHALNVFLNPPGELTIHMCSGARFFVNHRSGSDLSCSQSFPTFEDAVAYAASEFSWVLLEPEKIGGPNTPQYFQFHA